MRPPNSLGIVWSQTYLSLILGVFAKITLEILLQQGCYLFCLSCISNVLSWAVFCLNLHGCMVSAASMTKTLIQSRGQEDIAN